MSVGVDDIIDARHKGPFLSLAVVIASATGQSRDGSRNGIAASLRSR
jgi:hypothetical protein